MGCELERPRSRQRLRIDLRLEDRIIDLALEGVDVAIRVATPLSESADLVAHRLTAFRRILVASPEYLKRRGEPGSPEALVKHDVLIPRSVWTSSEKVGKRACG